MEDGGQNLACTACKLTFQTADQQREHYRLEWHRYNLKRKVAGLGPVSLEVFETRLAAIAPNTVKKPFSGKCNACNKHYSTENAYNQHLLSKKHKEAESKMSVERPTQNQNMDVDAKQSEQTISQSGPVAETQEEGKTEEDDDEEEAIKLEITECLFCRHNAKSFKKNLDHMVKAHSFFIPDIEYLVDLEGLISYLGDKVAAGHVCLYCNHRGRSLKSLEAVRAHMIDKSHCKLNMDDDEAEFEEFYDFSTSYPDWQERLKEQTLQRNKMQTDETVPEGEDEWEDEESGDESADDSDDTEGKQQRKSRARARVSPDMPLAVYDDVGPVSVLETGELMLHSGKILGTRDLKFVYKQKYRPEDKRNLIGSIINQYKALGMAFPTKRSQPDMDKRAHSKQFDSYMRLGIKGNDTYQTYWRQQTLV
eukprot:GILK01003229.1.p1 GENE.GILK01003229.1~~GILK01003229.1.p1  ORF type:complete len:440 (-),score=64.39 GILK01003229.1:96-1361(-)